MLPDGTSPSQVPSIVESIDKAVSKFGFPWVLLYPFGLFDMTAVLSESNPLTAFW